MFRKLFMVLFGRKVKGRRLLQVKPSCGPEMGRKLYEYTKEMDKNVRDYLARRDLGQIS